MSYTPCNSSSDQGCTYSDSWVIRVQSQSCQTGEFTAPDDFVNTILLPDRIDMVYGVTFRAPCMTLARDGFVITAGFLDYDETEPGVLLEQKNATVLVCTPKYSIDQVTAHVDQFGNVLDIISDLPANASDGRQLPSMSGWDFFTRFDIVLKDAMNTLDSLTLDVLRNDEEQIVVEANGNSYQLALDRFFTLYVSLFGVDVSSLMDTSTVHRRSQLLFSSVSAQIAKEYLMVPDQKAQSGTYSVSEYWLHIRGLSLYWILATISALLLLTGLLFFYIPGRVVSRDPGSIGGLTTILARSPSLAKTLSAHGASGIPTIRQVLKNCISKSCMEHTDAGPEFRIDIIITGQERKPAGLHIDEPTAWWRPFSISASTKSTFIIVLAISIAVLEVLFQTSEKRQGLTAVETSGYVRYTWVYLPGLVMLAMQLLVGMVSFTSNVFLPYHELRHWPSRAQPTLLNDQLSRLTIHSLVDSIMGGHWAITATATAMLLAPFLTIVASGLYTADPELVTSGATVTIDSVFDFHNVSYAITESAQIFRLPFFTSMILQQNLPSPSWTYAGLAYPEITISPDNIPDSLSTGASLNLTVLMPALRSSLVCSSIPESGRNVTSWVEESTPNMKVQFPVPEGCMDNGETEYVADLFGYEGYPSALMDAMLYNNTQFGCPSVLILYGAEESNLKFVTCTKSTQQLQVKTTFELPSYTIVATEPDEASAVELVDGVTAAKLLIDAASEFVEGSSLNNPYTYFNISDGVTDTILIEAANAANLSIEDVVSGTDTAPLERTMQRIWKATFAPYANLIARIPVAAATTVATTLSSYTMYTAQESNTTITFTPAPNITASTANLTGTLTYPSTSPRLRQDATSTRILEALLAAIALCIAASFWGMNTREILPKDPCGGIAAAASLLAGGAQGSSLLLREEVVPRGAEWMSDRELAKRGAFEGRVFSMGWRDDGGGEEEGVDGGRRRRWFGIDVGRAEWM